MLPETTATLRPSSAPIRTEPVQARSAARLATLLDSAAAVIDEIGYERLTTAMVAERANASIGTVYRYFPDRIAVLQAVATRNSERFLDRIVLELPAATPASATDALLTVLDLAVELFRTEPGFRSIRVGDVLDLLPPTQPETGNGIVAATVSGILTQQLGFVLDARGRAAVATAIEVIDALVARAFSRNRYGDAALLDEARRAVTATVAGIL